MSDLISGQAAIDALCRSCSDGCLPCVLFPCSDVDAINNVPSAQPERMCVNLDIQKITTHKSDFSDLDELPSTQPEQRWIPVSERLPEYYEPVLTWDGDFYFVEKRIPYICDDEGKHIVSDWWVSDDYDELESDYYPNLRDGAAIAWQPLPKPYKGEE